MEKNLGLLVNFGRQKAVVERLAFDAKEKKIVEDYSQVKGKIDEPVRQYLAKLREALFYVLDVHGLGYGMVIYRDLLRAELDYREIMHSTNAPICVKHRGKLIRTVKAKAIRITDQFFVE